MLLVPVILATSLARVGAQPADLPPSRPRADGVEVREAKPEVYYLRDERGRLVYVPSFSFEKWDELVKQQRGLNVPQTPQFAFQDEVQLTGLASDQFLEYEVSMAIRLNEFNAPTAAPPGEPVPTVTPEPKWIRVPLRMSSAALIEPPSYEGDGRYFVEFDAKGDGYVLWLRGLEGSRHSFKLHFSVPLVSLGNERRLTLRTPSAPTRLKIRVNGGKVLGTLLNPGASLLKTEQEGDAATTFTLVGSSGEFQFSWKDAQMAASTNRNLLDVVGNILVRIEGRSRLRTESKFRVRSYGKPIQEVKVRLPEEMRYIPDPALASVADYQISNVEDADAPVGRQQLLVRFSRESNSPPEIRIGAEWIGPAGSVPGTSLDIGDFQIGEAVRHTGAIEIAVEADVNVRWNEGQFVNRVDAISDASRQQRVVARFEYEAQPCSLKLEITPKTTRVSVEPIYLVDVQPNRLEIQAYFRYSVTGGKVSRLEIDPADWTIHRVLPATLLSGDNAWDSTKPISVPLALDLQGSFEVQLQASRELKGNAINLENFPRPRSPQGVNATLTVVPATVAVTVADNLELELLSEQLKGLVVEPIAPSISLPVRQQSPLFFREQPGSDKAVLPAKWKLRPRAVSITTKHLVTVSTSPQRVETRLQVQVANESLDQVIIEGTREVLTSDALQISLDNQGLPLSIIEDAPAIAGAAQRARARIELPEKRVGTFELLLDYVPTSVPAVSGSSSRYVLPLIGPVADSQTVLGPMSLRLKPTEAVSVTVPDELWTPSPANKAVPVDGEPVELLSSANPPSVQLELRKVTTGRSGTIVHRAWLQTWLSVQDRRDRAVFYVTTNERRLRVQVPATVREADIEVALDRRPIRAPRLVDQELQIEVPPSNAQLPHVIEVWCWLRRPPARWGRQDLETIRLIGSDRVDRLQWEVALPPHELLLSGPPDLVAEYSWQWARGVWQRVPYYGQHDLENWVGATPARSVPDATNRYLFSSLGTPERIQFMTASRPWIVLLAAGPVLGLGVLAAAMRWWTRPVFLIGLGACLASLAMAVPDVSLLLGQAALVGVGLAAVSQMLSPRRPTRYPAVREPGGGSAVKRPESRSLEFHTLGAVPGSSVRKSTAPIPIPADLGELPP